MTTCAGAADRLPRDAAGFVDVRRLLSPRSVIVIGASGRVGNFGGDTIQRLLTFEFPEPIYPVNPRGEKVRGLESFSSVAVLPGVAGSGHHCARGTVDHQGRARVRSFRHQGRHRLGGRLRRVRAGRRERQREPGSGLIP
jgi:hypothetical protein